MDKKNRLLFIVFWLIVTMVVTATAQADDRCSRSYMQNPTGDLTKMVVSNALDDDADVRVYYSIANFRSNIGNKIFYYINNVRDDIRGSWHSRQRIIDNVRNSYIPGLHNYFIGLIGLSASEFETNQKAKAADKKIKEIFVDYANHLYDTFCRCVISRDGSRSCAPPDMPDSFD